jgi:AAA domain-containing protein
VARHVQSSIQPLSQKVELLDDFNHTASPTPPQASEPIILKPRVHPVVAGFGTVPLAIPAAGGSPTVVSFPRIERREAKLVATIFANVYGTRCEAVSMTLAELANRCFVSFPSREACPLIKLARFGDVRSDHGSLRHDGNVISIHGVEADYDAGHIAFEDAVARLKGVGVSCVIYTTGRHTPDAPRWRILAPTARIISAEERSGLCDRMNGLFGGEITSESWTLSQAYFIGRVSGPSAKHFRCEVLDGRPIDRCPLDHITPLGRNGAGKTRTGFGVGFERRLDPDEALRQVLGEGPWHNAVRDLVARWVALGLTDCEILAHAAAFTRAGYTVEQTEGEVREFIRSARAKGYDQHESAGAEGFQGTEDRAGYVSPLEVRTTEGLLPQPRTFGWAPFLPRGGLLTLAGRGGIGKTTLAIALAAWGSRGEFPDGWKTDPIRALLIEYQDDDADEVKPKLVANDYDPDNVLLLKAKVTPTFEELEATIRLHSLGFVLISPGRRFVMRYVKNENADAEVEPVLDRLHMMGKELGCLISLVKHTNKKPDLAAPERVAGASAYVNSARTVLFMAKDADSDLRVVESVKFNESLRFLKKISLVDVGEGAGPRHPTAYVRVDLSDCDDNETVATVMQNRPLSETRKRILDFFAKNRGDYSYKEVGEALDMPSDSARMWLNRMANSGQIVRGTMRGAFRAK